MTHFFRFFAVRLGTIVAAIALSVGALSLTVSWWLASDSVGKLATREFVEASQRQALAARDYLGAAVPAIETLDGRLGEDAPAGDALDRALLDVLRANPGFSWVSYADEQGTFTGAYRSGGKLRLNHSEIVGGKTHLVERELDASGWRVIRESADSGYDPRTRPFYVLAKRVGHRTWTDPYVVYGAHTPGISCVRPHFASSGQLAGVLTIDFSLDALSSFARDAQPSPRSDVFVFTPEGTLLSHPRLALVAAAAAGEELVSLRSVSDPVLRAYANASRAGSASFTFDAEGTSYLATATPFAVDQGITWTVGVLAPQSDFVGPVHRHLAISFAILAVLLIVAIALSIPLVADRFSSPLRALSVEMEQLGRLDLAQRPLPSSGVLEIANMTRALSAMKGGLASFARYVPRDLVRRLLEHGQEATLGGKTQELTIFFSDVASFTTLSESLSPEELVQVLGEYLDEMTRIIAEHGGTVDKFLGDGILAFWGAPEPDSDPALRATRAAIACVERLDVRAKTGGFHGHVLHTRIGVATGEVVVGNIGTPERLNYTVMGDPVNLASRLEGLNKVYGTQVLIDARTAESIGERLACRAVDYVAVKGKEQAVRVFAPLPGGDASAQRLVRLSARALQDYFARDFRAASEGFREMLQLVPKDGPAQVLLARAEKFAVQPPGADWKGSYIAESK